MWGQDARRVYGCIVRMCQRGAESTLATFCHVDELAPVLLKEFVACQIDLYIWGGKADRQAW